MIKAKVKYAIQVCYNHSMREIELELFDDDLDKKTSISLIRLSHLEAKKLVLEIADFVDVKIK